MFCEDETDHDTVGAESADKDRPTDIKVAKPPDSKITKLPEPTEDDESRAIPMKQIATPKPDGLEKGSTRGGVNADMGPADDKSTREPAPKKARISAPEASDTSKYSAGDMDTPLSDSTKDSPDSHAGQGPAGRRGASGSDGKQAEGVNSADMCVDAAPALPPKAIPRSPKKVSSEGDAEIKEKHNTEDAVKDVLLSVDREGLGDEMQDSGQVDEGDGDGMGEVMSASKKPRGRRKRAGGIELDEEILQQQLKGEGESGDEDGDDEGEGAPRYQSARAAAKVAKSRLSVSGTAKSRAGAGGGDMPEGTAPSEDKKVIPEVLPKQWVCCDTCGKWRSIPGEVDTSALPEQWHCSLNQWDELHNDCQHEEEEYVEEPGPVVVDPANSVRGEVEGGRGRGGRERAGRGGRRGRRPLHRENSGESFVSKGDEDAGGVGGVGVSTLGRKRRGRVPHGILPADEEADSIIQQLSSVVPPLENVTWVQCNKCSKWRKVPGRINQKDLPDVW